MTCVRNTDSAVVVDGMCSDAKPSTSGSCNTQACPIERIEDHFQFLDTFTWGGWSPCSKACGGGISSRTQQRTVLPPFGGKACGANTETKSCNQQNCAVDCLMGA